MGNAKHSVSFESTFGKGKQFITPLTPCLDTHLVALSFTISDLRMKLGLLALVVALMGRAALL